MKVNGQYVEGRWISLSDLISSQGFREDRIAVELNGMIVPKSEYPTTVLKEEDSIEIVGLVGGG